MDSVARLDVLAPGAFAPLDKGKLGSRINTTNQVDLMYSTSSV